MNENLIKWINEDADRLDPKNLRLIYDVSWTLGLELYDFDLGLLYACVEDMDVVLCREWEDDYSDPQYMERRIPKHLFLESDPIEAARELRLSDRKRWLENRIEYRVAEIKRLQEEVEAMDKEIVEISLSLADSVRQT